MYTRLAIVLGASFRLASSSPLVGGTLQCPDLSILDGFQQPVSAVCSCFPPKGTSTSTVSTTTTTDLPQITTTTTTTLEAPTVTTTTTIIPDAITVVVPTTVTTTTLNCFTTGGVQLLVPQLKKRGGSGNDWNNNNGGKPSSSKVVAKTSSSVIKAPASSPAKPASSVKVTSSPAPGKPTTSSWKATSTPDKFCAAVTGKPVVSGLVSAACSCVDAYPYITTTTVTTTFVSTNPVSTSTITSSTTTTQTDTVIELGATPTVTTTNTINVAAASPTGAPYFYYNPLSPPLMDGQPYTGVEDTINSLSSNPGYTNTGTIRNLNSISGGTTITLPDGSQASGVQYGVVYQGYIFATDGPGTYTLTSRAGFIDNVGAAWQGDKAYGSNWNGNNADYIAGFPNGGSITVTLLANEARPFTIVFLNAGSPSRSDFVITNPLGTTTTTDNYLYADCGGNFVP